MSRGATIAYKRGILSNYLVTREHEVHSHAKKYKRWRDLPSAAQRNRGSDTNTGGKGPITQWVHAEYMEGSEIICPTFTQWVRGGYFSKVPTKVPTG